MEANYAGDMREQVLVLAEKFKSQIGKIRTVPGWQAALHLDRIWLKGPLNNGEDQLLLYALPVIESYEIDEQNRLFPLNSLTPTAIMEPMDWQAITDFLPVELPVSALPGTLQMHMPVRLLRVASTKPTYALQISLPVWRSFVDGAPLVRLQQLRFAVSTDQQVLVVGDPLPPVPGTGYWRNGNLLIPVGFDFDPPLLADLLVHRLDTKEGFIVFNENGQWTNIPAYSLHDADRALIRQIS
jgi:hypothetical protein